MIVGAVNAGGRLPEGWVGSIVAALDAGLNVATGLHIRLADVPEICAAAARNGRELFDVRHSHETFATGKGVKRTGLRLLTVGTDCSVGKKCTALAMETGMRAGGSMPISAPPGRPASSSPAAASPSTRWSPTSSPAPSSGCRPTPIRRTGT